MGNGQCVMYVILIADIKECNKLRVCLDVGWNGHSGQLDICATDQEGKQEYRGQRTRTYAELYLTQYLFKCIGQWNIYIMIRMLIN